MGRAQGEIRVAPSAAYTERLAADYATTLLRTAGAAATDTVRPAAAHWAVLAALSGLTLLSGRQDDAPRHCPAPLAACADGALAALRMLPGGDAIAADIDGASLLTERAAIRGLQRGGMVAPGGSCRLLMARDGLLALNLSRDADWALLPALFDGTAAPAVDDWAAVAAALGAHTVDMLLSRARLLGLAVAAEASLQLPSRPWLQRYVQAKPRAAALDRPPRVLDLSGLWAGPLASHLMHCMGAKVVKLESWQRPDGARNGDRAFYDLLNAGKQSVAIDWGSAEGKHLLHRLIDWADIVVESARPRALRQIGINAEKLVRGRPGLTWISLTGFGRDEPEAHWVAYGDDAGVAAGLSQLMRLSGSPSCFVGDAVADPLTGLHAAVAAMAAHAAGGAVLLGVALVDVVRHCIHAGGPLLAAADVAARLAEADAACRAAGAVHAMPEPRRSRMPAAALGADNAAVTAMLDAAC